MYIYSYKRKYSDIYTYIYIYIYMDIYISYYIKRQLYLSVCLFVCSRLFFVGYALRLRISEVLQTLNRKPTAYLIAYCAYVLYKFHVK